jgi:hypothetical protein
MATPQMSYIHIWISHQNVSHAFSHKMRMRNLLASVMKNFNQKTNRKNRIFHKQMAI